MPFLKYIQLIKELKPKFFLAENVKGMLNSRNRESFEFLMSELESVGYNFTYKLMNVADYGVPQTRERVIFVGFSKDINQNLFIFQLMKFMEIYCQVDLLKNILIGLVHPTQQVKLVQII